MLKPAEREVKRRGAETMNRETCTRGELGSSDDPLFPFGTSLKFHYQRLVPKVKEVSTHYRRFILSFSFTGRRAINGRPVKEKERKCLRSYEATNYLSSSSLSAGH